MSIDGSPLCIKRNNHKMAGKMTDYYYLFFQQAKFDAAE